MNLRATLFVLNLTTLFIASCSNETETSGKRGTRQSKADDSQAEFTLNGAPVQQAPGPLTMSTSVVSSTISSSNTNQAPRPVSSTPTICSPSVPFRMLACNGTANISKFESVSYAGACQQATGNYTVNGFTCYIQFTSSAGNSCLEQRSCSKAVSVSSPASAQNFFSPDAALGECSNLLSRQVAAANSTSNAIISMAKVTLQQGTDPAFDWPGSINRQSAVSCAEVSQSFGPPGLIGD